MGDRVGNGRVLGRGCVLCLAMLLCVACSNRDEEQPVPDAASMIDARTMDHIESLLEQGAYADAAAALQQAHEDGLEHPRAAFLQGTFYLRRGKPGDLEKAIPWFVEAAKGAPYWHLPRVELAQIYLKLKRLTSADMVYQELDSIYPKSPAGPFGRGQVALLRNRVDEAQGHFKESLRRDPGYTPALRSRAYLARKKGDVEREQEFLRLYVNKKPLDPSAHHRMGQLFESQGLLESARRSLEYSYELRPDAAVARRLADLARRRGDQQTAAKWDKKSE